MQCGCISRRRCRRLAREATRVAIFPSRVSLGSAADGDTLLPCYLTKNVITPNLKLDLEPDLDKILSFMSISTARAQRVLTSPGRQTDMILSEYAQRSSEL